MGSIRRATWRQFAIFLGLNVLVSAITVLIVLSIWDRGRQLPAIPPTPTVDVVARVASAIPTVTPTLPPTITPVTYTVKGGDTLGGIAAELGIPIEVLMAANGLTDPDELSVGQVLLVPTVDLAAQSTAIPAAAQEPTEGISTQAELAQVVIRGAYERENLEKEYVYLENTGGVASMAGWTLDDGDGNVYIFPNFTLYTGGGVNVYTRVGTDSVINLFWGMGTTLWGGGKVATLRDAGGAVQSTFEIPGS
jgi:LysM repeat protein